MVKNRAGNVQEVDVSCDSDFMEKVMPKVGKAIRDSYHWVPLAIPIFLYLNDAGGHGTKEVVGAYVRTLADDWNVIFVHLDSIKLQNVYNCWLMVLDFIIDDNGGNALVETKRGKLYPDPSAEMEVFDDKVENTDDIDAETLNVFDHTDV